MASTSATHDLYYLSAVKAEEPIDDVDAHIVLTQDVLTPMSPARRESRRSTLSAHPYHRPSTTTVVVIPPQQNTFTHNNGQDVPPILSDQSRRSISVSSTSSHSQHVRINPEHRPLSSTSSLHHASLNQPIDRLRTHLPFFGTTTELAAHYGIPHKLPPTPSVTNNQNTSATKQSTSSFDATSPAYSLTAVQQDQFAEWQLQLEQYINMTSTPPQDSSETTSSAMSAPPMQPVTDGKIVGNADLPSSDMLAGTFLRSLSGVTAKTQSAASSRRSSVPTPGLCWDEFLTSPFDDSPMDTFLDTPANFDTSLGDDFYTSPLVADISSSFDPSFTDIPVFADEEFVKMSANLMLPPPPPTAAPLNSSELDGLFTMSPLTPAIHDVSVLPSPQVVDESSLLAKTSTKHIVKKGPNGTRKNITPESLVPFDAPTQTRNYVTPSLTSRKALPAVFAKKRARSTAFGDEEDELDVQGSSEPPVGSEADAIAAKRRQNTLAARRSRKRKLEHQRDLENAVETERKEKEAWRGKAMFYEAHIKGLGMVVPYYPEPE